MRIALDNGIKYLFKETTTGWRKLRPATLAEIKKYPMILLSSC